MHDLSNFHYLKAQDHQISLGNRFLKRYKQSQAGKQDSMYLAKTAAPSGNQIVGAVWLQNNPDHLWLRSLFIAPSLRQKGIAKQLVRSCFDEMHQKPSYCFPWQELESFYEELNFATISPQELPKPLERRFQRYQKNGRKILAMRFKGAASQIQK